ncbi:MULTISPECIES: ABC transporter ATP-binding protein [Aurantimonas]|uniref:iron ABC transporter ATP-binding protein n=1 Tax=Aurantimonas TaxID=182269 RepID=UPI00165209A0|nr:MULTISPECIES: ATP-binding cassette domain-containing protein [Aurantimonas]MBC6716327.1 ATP-binding cassette domain-containing protein [Aurantimonas sp. DM33-3]MCD1641636.1 ATP-binding cassette domain-containing protein [Aurantimonas coralicida]
MIEAEHLTKRYDRALVVDGVSLSLPAGGVTAIIGPNGAGKSTLLSMIARLLPMDGGRVLVDGLDVTRTKGDELAKRLAILRQENGLSVRLTVRDLVGFGRFPHSKGRMRAADHAKVAEAIAYLDLSELAERYLDELSGGQRQRAFVAMVLAQDTGTILLDEPLNNLDIRHAVAMMRLIRRAADELGKTIVVVLHDINFASAYADRIVAMCDGKVAHEGPVAAVITEAVVEAVFGLPVMIREIEGQRTCLFRR